MKHRFEWMHVEPRCDPRCDHYEHWETRCVECGERECVLSRDTPCFVRETRVMRREPRGERDHA